MPEPNCYKCKWRGTIPGDAHSRCCHPKCGGDNSDPFGRMMAMFANVGRVAPVMSATALEMGVTGNPHGIKRGWFNWPWNFDPVWLESCNGFEPKGGDEGAK